MHETDHYFIIFHTIHDVLRAEKALKKLDISVELVPVPRQLSSDCGSCIRITGTPDKALSLLDGYEIQGCYIWDGNTYELYKP